jgi:prepilin-type N-terminal cleavage/methylation domain-containing protein
MSASIISRGTAFRLTAGFTLIEMAMVLFIISLALGAVFEMVGAAAITAFARSKLQQGHTFRSILGRQRYLITASEQSARLARP